MSRRTRRSSPRRCCHSWPDVRPTAQSCGPVWDRQSAPRCRPRAAPWPRHAHSHHWLPLPPWSPGACEARQPVCGALGQCSEMPAAATTRECIHPPCPWPRRYRRQHVCLVPSSTPFLARFGLEALATVRVEEDTGAVPRSDTGSVVRFSALRRARPSLTGLSPPCENLLARPALPRPPLPAPYVRDDRDTPLLWARDGGSCTFDLGQARSGIFFAAGLDRF